MKAQSERTTVVIPRPPLGTLGAGRSGGSGSAVVGEAARAGLAGRALPAPRSSVGIAASGRGDVAERAFGLVGVLRPPAPGRCSRRR